MTFIAPSRPDRRAQAGTGMGQLIELDAYRRKPDPDVPPPGGTLAHLPAHETTDDQAPARLAA